MCFSAYTTLIRKSQGQGARTQAEEYIKICRSLRHFPACVRWNFLLKIGTAQCQGDNKKHP